MVNRQVYVPVRLQVQAINILEIIPYKWFQNTNVNNVEIQAEHVNSGSFQLVLPAEA